MDSPGLSNLPHSFEVTKSYAEKQTSRFHALNEKEINNGTVGKIRQLLGKIRQLLGERFFLFNDSFKWQTHMHAEHMSQGSFAGGMDFYGTAKTIELLEKTNNPPADLIKALNYAKNVSVIGYSTDFILIPTVVGKIASHVTVSNVIKNDIRNLQPDESLAIPSSSAGHAMMLFITRQPDGTFKVVQHNQGEGINKYHYGKADDNGKQLYQTALEIEGISEQNLCGWDSFFIDRILINGLIGSTDTLYTEILPLLKGTVAPASEDSRLWGHGQLGGSCTAACGLSLVRSQLDETSYKEFRELGRTEMLLKSYKEIKSGWGNNSIQRTVTLEVVKKLESSLKKRGKELPDEIKEMRRQLEAIAKDEKKFDGGSAMLNGIPIKAHLDNEKEVVFEGLPDNMNVAFTILKAGNFTDASIEAAKPYIDQVAKTFRGESSDDEMKKILELSSLLTTYCKGRALTSNQTYMMALFSSVLYNKMLYLPEESASDSALQDKIKNISDFNFNMVRRYNELGLGSLFQNDQYDYLISHFQRSYFASSAVSVPEGLAKLQQNQK